MKGAKCDFARGLRSNRDGRHRAADQPVCERGLACVWDAHKANAQQAFLELAVAGRLLLQRASGPSIRHGRLGAVIRVEQKSW